MVAKITLNEALVPLALPIVKRVLVVGGGIAGMTAALDIANAGYPVVLIERAAQLGGNMARLSNLYLNLQPAANLLGETVHAVLAHPCIEVRTGTTVDELSGYVGNFTITLRSTAADGADSIRTEINAGALVLATGYDLYNKERLSEYGGGRCADVIDGLEFEDMLRPDGPTGGHIIRPSDGATPREVVWIQCAGSRDPQLHKAYAPKYAACTRKTGHGLQTTAPGRQAYVFYIDIRSQASLRRVRATARQSTASCTCGQGLACVRGARKIMWSAQTR